MDRIEIFAGRRERLRLCACARACARACLCVRACVRARARAHSSMVRYGWLRGTAAVDRLESPPTLSNASRSSADHSSIASTRMSSDFARECVQPTTPSTLCSTKAHGSGEACSGSSVRCVPAFRRALTHSVRRRLTVLMAHRYGYSWRAAMICYNSVRYHSATVAATEQQADRHSVCRWVYCNVRRRVAASRCSVALAGMGTLQYALFYCCSSRPLDITWASRGRSSRSPIMRAVQGRATARAATDCHALT